MLSELTEIAAEGPLGLFCTPPRIIEKIHNNRWSTLREFAARRTLLREPGQTKVCHTRKVRAV